MRLTKMVTEPKYWEEDVLGDGRLGWIPVWLNNEIRIAKPLFNPMTLQVITKEFMEKYGEGLGIYVEVDPEGIVWWTGFCLFKNSNLFPKFEEEYPYLRVKHFDEGWMEIFSSYKGKERWEIKSLGDEISSIKMDIAAKLIVLNNLGINGLQFQEDSTVLIEPKLFLAGGESSLKVDSEKKEVELDNSGVNSLKMTQSGTTVKENVAINLGGEDVTEPAVLGQKVQTWLSDLLTAMQTETHNVTAVGAPSGPPINSAAYASLRARLPEIASILVKLK